ncbi:putative lipoprotein YdeJ [Thalassobacillus devorans]|uniref:Lipoprotein YdeJ n=1 Tax=Thalassobacillus devorans TaxID=279813 RepID=A0ABQ1NHU8_9BACI|nr:hypothetical protein [Thalassobacillus devorans]NIK27410.1 hypothetical protein [Thalassobacillus devorans]GGC77505.1 putative lipoprotein YdeJ [Thalassobacillus devorans]
MKKLIKVFGGISLLLLLVLLLGCSAGTAEETNTDAAVDSEEESKTNNNEDSETEKSGDEDSEATSSGENTSNEESDTASGSAEEDPLADYSSEEIEYARVWLQLGELKEVDELNVRHIPSGTPLNPDDETSADYPEEVIQLAGSRLVAGSVIYSGNGDGTINVYHVPLRWDGEYPAGESFYSDLIENTKLVAVDTGNEKDIIELIEVLNIHN